MSDGNFAESVLALFAGRERTVAIMGDLTQLSATRGRLWFWGAYARTLISLGWRTPVALVSAMVSGFFLYRTVGSWILHHPRAQDFFLHVAISTKAPWRLSFFNYFLTALTAQGLSFALPFVLIRFGTRDRLSQLACGLFLITLPFLSVALFPMDLSTGLFVLTISSTLCALAIAVALLLPLWRRPMIVLAATCLPAVANEFLLDLVRSTHVLHASSTRSTLVTLTTWRLRFPVTFAIYKVTSFTLAALVCVSLYGRLLQGRPVTDRKIA